MKHLYQFTLLAFLPLLMLLGRAGAQPAPQPLESVLLDMSGYVWSDVQDEAEWEAMNDGPVYYSAPESVVFHENFEGTFSPQADSGDSTQLAIFSDDGSNVFVDDITNGQNPVRIGEHNKLDVNQALPALNESLHQIKAPGGGACKLQEGRTYRIRVEYSNTIYKGTADIDGATLFVYSELGPPQDKVWSPDTAISGGAFVSPPTKIGAGGMLGFAVSKAVDKDKWTQGTQSKVEDDEVRYRWTCSAGAFVRRWNNGVPVTTDDDGQPLTELNVANDQVNPGVKPGVTWIAPTIAGDVTITCEVDDEPLPAAPGSGSRDDDPLTNSAAVTVDATLPTVTFKGLPRACAGGIDDSGQTDPQYRAHTFMLDITSKKANGDAFPNTDFTFTFENNVGHDYTNDAADVKPAGWTIADKKTAKVSGGGAWSENVILTTDANGDFKDAYANPIKLKVLSSDVISQPSLVAKWKDAANTWHVVGSVACDFAEAIGKRRFPDATEPESIYPEDDNGWLFTQQYLVSPNAQTTAKIYLKFMVDPTKGDVNGNWCFVNGHRVLFGIEKIDLSTDSDPNGTNADYAILIANTSSGQSVHETINDGAATALVMAKNKIEDVDTIWLQATILSQWDK